MGNGIEIREIGEDRYLQVAVRGGAFYLYLPKRLVKVHGLMAGDTVEVRLKRRHRPKEGKT